MWAEILREIVRALEEDVDEKEAKQSKEWRDPDDLSSQRVCITQRDHYYKREGVLVDQRGSVYWNICLKGNTERSAVVIYKKQGGFEVM